MAPKGLNNSLTGVAIDEHVGLQVTEVCALLSDVVWRGRMARAAGAATGCLVSLAVMVLFVSITLSGGNEANEEALSLDKGLEYAAIQAILRHLDDNHDGSVDVQESEEFVQMELQETPEKSHRFHETDSQITSEDLWQSWQQNEVFHWTNTDVVQWLVLCVELPQYRDIFHKLNISGRHLPRLANNTGHMLQTLLGITDSQHKQKLRLRAMDLVLFGPPNGKSSLWKDVVLVMSVSLCVVGVAYALRQRRDTQRRIDTFLVSFRERERELRALQERLEEQKESCEDTNGRTRGGREGESSSPESPLDSSPSPESEVSLPPLSRNSFSSQSSSFDGCLARAQEEISLLRREIDQLNSQLASNTISKTMLQSLLQDSCRYEREHVERRRREAQDEITRAQRVCNKIKKRRSSLFGTFHLANSSALEEAGLQITRAVNNMQKVSESFEEYHQRWRRIEQVCNFPIVSSASVLSSPATFSLPRDSSSSSLKSLDGDSADGMHGTRDSFSRQSEGYCSSDTGSVSLSYTPSSSPQSSLRARHRPSRSGSLNRDAQPLPNSPSSLYTHHYQCSCPSLSNGVRSGALTWPVDRGQAKTLPPTSSMPRNFTVSGQLVSRQESYNAAVESNNSSGGGLTMSNDRGRSGRRRLSDTGCEYSAGMMRGYVVRKEGREGGNGRRNSLKRQPSLGLSAVHEEDVRTDTPETFVATMTTTPGRGGLAQINIASAQSTV